MKNEEMFNLRLEIEQSNKEKEKESKLQAIKKEIDFEKGIINIINNIDETLKKFNGKVYNKRFNDALQGLADKEEISIKIDFNDYQKKEIRINFCEICSIKYEYKYKYQQLINCTVRTCDMCMIKHRLRHEMDRYYTVVIENAFYVTETKKERLIAESFKKALEEYEKKLLKDIGNLQNEINKKEETLKEFKKIKDEYETLYKKNREFQRKHDLTVLTLLGCDYDFYSSKNKWK